MFDPVAIAADVEAKRRAGRLVEARDALHAALPYAPADPSICYAGGRLYDQLGYAREAVRFLEVVEKSRHPTLAAEASALLTRIARDGTQSARDVAVCVLSLAEIYRTMMTPYARAWSYPHWESATLADPCWVLNVTHLAGAISGGHASPPGHPYAWWTVRYAIEAIDPTGVAGALGGRFGVGEVLVFLETETMGLDWVEPNDTHRLGTFAPRAATALERVTPPIDASRLRRVYVAGRVGPTSLLL